MEFFNKTKAVKLRSHLDKYLVADDDQETVRQSRNGGSLRKARWLVELVEEKSHVIRLKSCHGRYLTASDVPFLLGMTGKRVIQSVPDSNSEPSIEWEPIRDGFQVRLRTQAGKYMRANGGTAPWRNSITHDNPQTSGTKDWVLWDVEEVEIPESDEFKDYLTSISSFSSVADELLGLEPASPNSVFSNKSPSFSPKKFFSEKSQSFSPKKFFTEKSQSFSRKKFLSTKSPSFTPKKERLIRGFSIAVNINSIGETVGKEVNFNHGFPRFTFRQKWCKSLSRWLTSSSRDNFQSFVSRTVLDAIDK